MRPITTFTELRALGHEVATAQTITEAQLGASLILQRAERLLGLVESLREQLEGERRGRLRLISNNEMEANNVSTDGR